MDEEILNTTEEIENEEEPVVEANTQSADVSANSTSDIDKIIELIRQREFETGDKSIDWKDLVDFLKKEKTHLGYSPIYSTDVDGHNSLFNYIDNRADMDNTDNETYNYTDFVDAITKKSDGHYLNNFWNESVGTVVRKVADLLGNSEKGEWSSASENGGIDYTNTTEDGVHTNVSHTHGSIEVSKGELKNKGGFRVKSVKNANAGNDFGTRNSTWVIPNYNIDAETYAGVRGNDKITKVLNNSKELQFTHTQDQSTITTNELNKYLRLIMPKYLRRVEVEDLNRNFWVIGQTLSAISAFLFDEEGPLPEIFKGILSEITQLWENIMYLWAGLAIEQEKAPVTKVHTEVVYLPNSDLEDHMSYDDIKGKTSWSAIMDKLAYLIDSYPECNLCIIPVIRHGCYEHNYYKGENWPGIVFYDRNNPKTTNHGFFHISWHYASSDRNEGNFNVNDFIDCASGFIETENGISYVKPFSDIVDDETLGNDRYFMAIRSVPTASATYVLKEDAIDPDVNYNYFTNLNLHIDFIDVARDLEERTHPSSYNTQDSLYRRRVGYFTFQSTLYIHDTVDLASSTVREIDDSTAHTTNSFNIVNKGYYLGELMSTSMITEARYKLKVDSIPLTPINAEIDNISLTETEEKKRTAAMLTLLKNNEISHDEDQLSLYVGRSKVALYHDKVSPTNDLGEYYDYSNLNNITWKDTYADSDQNNKSSESYDIGAILWLPWGEQIDHSEYKYASRQMPVRTGTKASVYDPPSPVCNRPKIWKGGRTCCSYITLSGMKSNRSISTARHREQLTYYYMWTPDGKKPTKSSDFVLYVTQVTVNYGILPRFRSSGFQDQSVCKTDNGAYIYPLVKNDAAYSSSSYCNFVDIRTNSGESGSSCIDEYGRKKADQVPLNWSSDNQDNASAFVSKKQYGWAVDNALFAHFLLYLKNSKRYNYPQGLTVHFKYTHKRKNNDDSYGTIYNDNVSGNEWTFSLLGPWRAGIDDCEISTDSNVVDTTYTFSQEMLDEFKKYNTGKHSQIQTNTLGGISTFFGSVTEIKTYRYFNDKPYKARVNWWSRYYTDNGQIVLTGRTTGFEDLTHTQKPEDGKPNPLEMIGNLKTNSLSNWKLAYAGDLQSEGIEKDVANYIKENGNITIDNFSNLQTNGICPDFTHFHYNGYNSYKVPES